MNDTAGGPPSRALARGLTLVPMTAMLVSGVIGAGVFVKARAMTCNVGTPGMVLLAYAAAGALTLAGALTFAELSAMLPRAGGQYNYIGAAFGRRWAFLFGWMETILNGAASIAAVAMITTIFFNDAIGGILSARQVQWLTVGVITIVSLLTLASIHANGMLASTITLLKVLLVAGIGVAAFLLSHGSAAHYAQSGAAGLCQGVPPGARLGMAGFGAAMVGALWSYTGWQTSCSVAEEVRDPGYTMPRALISGIIILICLYLFVTAGYFYALDPLAIANVPESTSVAGAVMVKILGASGASLVSLGMMLSAFGCLHVLCVLVARVPFAMARDGLLPAALARVSPRTRAPSGSTVLVGAGAAIFAFSGTFDVLTDMIVFMLLLFNSLAVASVYVLRRKLPDTPRPYRVWGYPLMPAVFLVASAGLMINTLLAMPGRALAGTAIVALGLPMYAYYSRGLPDKRAQDWLEHPGG